MPTNEIVTKNPYIYAAEYVKNYDGDTITLKIDLGFKASFTRHVRLANVDTPELRGIHADPIPARKAKDAVHDMLVGRPIVIHNVKGRKGKYGRYLATLFVKHDDEWINLNDWLIDNNYAVAYK